MHMFLLSEIGFSLNICVILILIIKNFKKVRHILEFSFEEIKLFLLGWTQSPCSISSSYYKHKLTAYACMEKCTILGIYIEVFFFHQLINPYMCTIGSIKHFKAEIANICLWYWGKWVNNYHLDILFSTKSAYRGTLIDAK